MTTENYDQYKKVKDRTKYKTNVYHAFVVSRKNLCFYNMQSTTVCIERSKRNPRNLRYLERCPAVSSVPLPNASFAFTRVSLIACIPLVAFAIFLQKFSSALSGILAGRVTAKLWDVRLPCVEACVVSRVSHRHTAGFPRTSTDCHVKIIVKTLRLQRRCPSPTASAH